MGKTGSKTNFKRRKVIMNSWEINKELQKHFTNYEYKLHNSFVFAWESDFFCKSKTGYYVECEVKISRGDFFVDFKKPKHKLFQAVFAKKKAFIEVLPNHYTQCKESLLAYNVRIPFLISDYGEPIVNARPFVSHNGHGNGSMRSRYGNWAKTYDDYDYSEPYEVRKQKIRNAKFIVNDYGNTHIGYKFEHIYAAATAVRIKPIESYKTPNQFYFAVPEGLITIDEVPKYAGLIYIKEEPQEGDNGYQFVSRTLKVIKKAPYMHKRSLDLTRVLLEKYYNLWCYKVDQNEKQHLYEKLFKKDGETDINNEEDCYFQDEDAA
jgi:hypothetical protein